MNLYTKRTEIINIVFCFIFIQEVCNLCDDKFLFKAERNIRSKILIPTKGEGEHLYQLIREYNKELSEIIKECKLNNSEVKLAVDYLIDKNGPIFLDITIDDVILMNKYGWESANFGQFYQLLSESKSLWRELKQYLVTIGVPTKSEVLQNIESLHLAFKD